MPNNISDPDVKKSLEVLIHEFESMESNVSALNDELYSLTQEFEDKCNDCTALENENEQLRDQIAELETALMEASLCGDADE